ncbi:MAG: hypothetical protein ACIAQZ_03300 [Sedimentisphaeraceae bacterium JB056]
MWLKWLPWKFLISRAARRHGFLDPLVVWSYLQRFSQPSEVAGPIELIRDSAVFHARGLINSSAIPQNSDWVWPYWVHRQFNPHDNSFIPRAFSLTYINLTERNWTAVGLPNSGYLPIVDKAGLLTPHWNGWSLDFWLVGEDKKLNVAARSDGKIGQRLFYQDNLFVVTRNNFGSGRLLSKIEVEYHDEIPCCKVQLRAKTETEGWLAIALRPYNPEGISFIHRIELDKTCSRWIVNDKDVVEFEPVAEYFHVIKKYSEGDVANHLFSEENVHEMTCDVGMATAAIVFPISSGKTTDVKLSIPLDTHKLRIYKSKSSGRSKENIASDWPAVMSNYCRINLPDKKKQLIYEQALRSVVLHTIGADVYPGPFTYKRFWFRDASFILNSLLYGNLRELAKPVLDSYHHRQKSNGYFQSQYGEWDSNGQAIWILYRYWKMMRNKNDHIDPDWIRSIEKAADWICEHCTSTQSESRHAGLLPAGFSAEHFGPNDNYYWDDFWAVSGLECAAEISSCLNREEQAKKYSQKSQELRHSIDVSLKKVAEILKRDSIPVSPYRRMDSGAVGSLVSGYPLQIYDSDDKKLIATANYLINDCCFKKGFFLDISHSGINPYLTLHIAQVLLRAGDMRHIEMADNLCRLASATGQWPEAVHPRTEGGCMGDGQHIWAAAEWVNYIRNCLLYEEEKDGILVIGAGIAVDWIKAGNIISIGPAPTLWGDVNIEFECGDKNILAKCSGDWSDQKPDIKVAIPGYEQMFLDNEAEEVIVNPLSK